MEKQQASPWKIAGSFWFSSFAAGTLVSTVLTVAVAVIIDNINNDIVYNLIIALVGWMAIWAGAVYAGKMTGKKYAIANNDDIAIKVFIIFAAVTMVLSAVRFFISAFTPILQFPGYTGLWGDWEAFGLGNIELMVTSLLYLLTARIYLKKNA